MKKKIAVIKIQSAHDIRWTLPKTLVNAIGMLGKRFAIFKEVHGKPLFAVERQRIVDATLVKREGTPQHVAHAVRFLLENDFVTGVCLPVDGGRSIYAGGL